MTEGPSHVRDGLDLKRMMMTVVIALAGCIYMAMYNTGYQATLPSPKGRCRWRPGRRAAWRLMGLASIPPTVACIVHGALYYLPVLIVTFAVGGTWEVIFAIVRKHEVNEGFLVTGMLFPLILPPTIPLWQVALGISFGVVIGKEIFGGTGMNILNPALTARAFLFFAYPARDIRLTSVDRRQHRRLPTAVSGATWLARAARAKGRLPCSGTHLVGRLRGFHTRVNGRNVRSCVPLGGGRAPHYRHGFVADHGGRDRGHDRDGRAARMPSVPRPISFDVPFRWHFVLGGWAFGMVFMATDPVSAPATNRGRYIYGFFIGVFAVLIRVVNPAYPEGMMLAILLMNVFAPVIDHYVVKANIKRRNARYATT